MSRTAILLATLNAKYIHASLGLRSLLANMGPLREQTATMEFIIAERPIDIVEALLAAQPRIVGLGVYIWNVEETEKVVALLKVAAPEVVVILGGPEVSHEWGSQRIVALADHVVTGPGEVALPALCARLLAGDRTADHVIAGPEPDLATLALPYAEYTDDDLQNRLIYVEASRGCPFRCEFCLSSLDKAATPFPLERFLGAMGTLYDRGARHFKFVDRTFNLHVKTSQAILDFFHARLDGRLFLHFELIPDHLPAALKAVIATFPPGSLQFEIGIQTFNADVQATISRRQNDARAEENLRWLRQHTSAHIHADLIAGLPGEDLDSFGRGFDRLVALEPQEIQVGLLKRLRGTPIIRHTDAFGMRYSPHPPYAVVATNHLDFQTIARLSRFARYWDLIANSGRFPSARPLLLGDQPFTNFLAFGDWLFARTGQTHQLALDRLFDLLATYLTEERLLDEANTLAALVADYVAGGQKGRPAFLARAGHLPTAPHPTRQLAARQARHLGGWACP